MPVHDWSRVDARIFHDFHGKWISTISSALNEGLLPGDYYSITEAHATEMIADVLTLQSKDQPRGSDHPGATALADAKPNVRVVETATQDILLARQRRVVVRHSSDDRVIALIEIVSPGTKARGAAFHAFVRKAVRAIRQEWHLLIVDLQPPSRRDPQGIHGALWPHVGGNPAYRAPEDKPLTLAAYEADIPPTAYVEPIAVGDALIDMPVFLAPGWYVDVPLEATYQAAFRGVPRRFRDVLEPPIQS